MKYIAVLLTVHNRKKKTLRCLDSLFSQQPVKGYKLEVWLTDDGSSDGTSDAIFDKYPEVHIVSGDGTLYWNRGMYKAWSSADQYRNYDYYMWVNDDTLLYPFTLYSLCRATEFTSSQAIIVGATQDSTHNHITYGAWEKNRLVVPNETLQAIEMFNGNIVLIPRQVYSIIGKLDYYFTHAKGDFDYGIRARKHGITIYLCGRILGECDRHNMSDEWCNPHLSIVRRFRALSLPTGMPPREVFYFDYQHYGLFSAVYHTCLVYLRCMFPIIWVFLKNK